MTRKSRNSARPTTPMAKSLRGLAAGVGRAHQVVARWIERPDWNQGRDPPWDIEQAKAWAAKTLGPNPADAWKQREEGLSPSNGDGFDALRRHPLMAARLKLTLTRTEMLVLQRAILAGEYVPRQEIEEALVRRAHAARAAFEALPRQLAGSLAGVTDEAAVEAILEEGIHNVLLELVRRPALPAPPSVEIEHE